ncbi:MAG: hypothetical protein ACR2RV_24350 [Verrucomicrobiales bacterium]
MKTQLLTVYLLLPLLLLTDGGADASGDPGLETLGRSLPSGAFAYAETSGFAELIRGARGSDLYQAIMASESTRDFIESEESKDLRTGIGLAQFIMRMDLWEAGEKLLGGRAAFALYPGAEEQGEPDRQEEPDEADNQEEQEEQEEQGEEGEQGEQDGSEILGVIEPADPSAWAKQRIWTDSLLMISARRILRALAPPGVKIYQTKGAEPERRFLALHREWVMFASDQKLLQRAIALRGAEPVGDSLGTSGADLERLAERLPGEHLARAFVDTAFLSAAGGGRLGLPEKMDNPMGSLLFGGVLEIAAHSELACLALDFEGGEFSLEVSLDGDPSELDQRYEVFFAGGRPSRPIPQIPGLIGGVTLHRDLATWYRSRDDLLQAQVLPGFDKFETGIGNILPGKDIGEDVVPLIGRNFTLLSALQDYEHLDGEPGVKLPGFAIIFDLAGPDPGAGADMFQLFFQTFLSVLNLQAAEQDRQPWLIAVEPHGGTPITYARYFERPAGEQLPVVFNFRPAAARVGDQYVICSSLGMCRDLVDCLGQPAAVASNDIHAHLDFAPLAAVLELNRQHLIAGRLNEGRDTKHAAEDIEHLFLALEQLGSLSSTGKVDENGFTLTVRGKLK